MTRVALVVAFVLLSACSTGAGGGSASDATQPSDSCDPEIQSSHQGGHLRPGESTTYDTYPPTGGRHDPVSLPAGLYDVPFNDDPAGSNLPSWAHAVHSLEHGYVIIVYANAADRDVLAERYAHQPKVIVVPADKPMQAPIATVSWDRARFCTAVDTSVLDDFITAHRGRPPAPEPTAG